MALTAIPSGEHWLKNRSPRYERAELARKIDVADQSRQQILNGSCASRATPPCALSFLWQSAQFWLNLQSLYDLRSHK